MKKLLLAAFVCASALQVAKIEGSAASKAEITIKNDTNELMIIRVASETKFKEYDNNPQKHAGEAQGGFNAGGLIFLVAGKQVSAYYDCTTDLIEYLPIKYNGNTSFRVKIPCNATQALIKSNDTVLFTISPKVVSGSGITMPSSGASNIPGGPAID